MDEAETETTTDVSEDNVIEAELPTKALMKQMKEFYPSKDWTQKQMNAHMIERMSSLESHVNSLTDIIRNLRLTAEPQGTQAKPQTFG